MSSDFWTTSLLMISLRRFCWSEKSEIEGITIPLANNSLLFSSLFSWGMNWVLIGVNSFIPLLSSEYSRQKMLKVSLIRLSSKILWFWAQQCCKIILEYTRVIAFVTRNVNLHVIFKIKFVEELTHTSFYFPIVFIRDFNSLCLLALSLLRLWSEYLCGSHVDIGRWVNMKSGEFQGSRVTDVGE